MKLSKEVKPATSLHIRLRKNLKMRQTNYWRRRYMSHWTPERRARQAALIRQWRPWERSSGPRTTVGKTASSRNAYRGGIRPMLRELSRMPRDQREAIEQVMNSSDRV
jgi:hypothetical protein